MQPPPIAALYVKTDVLVDEDGELAEWDDVAAEQWVAACEGWPHFDQFMALDVEKLA